MVNLQLSPNTPSPRLCIVKKSVDHQEYGFNLHAERGKGQFVGVVDDGSPAQKAGLKSGDRIFAVNGESIVGASHKEVVYKIKSNPMQCELLVISEEGAQWYREHGIAINSQMPNIIRACEEPIYSDVALHHSLTPCEMHTSPVVSGLVYKSNPVVVSKIKAQLRFSSGSDKHSVFSQVGASERKGYGNAALPHRTSDVGGLTENNNCGQNFVQSPSAKSMPPRPRLCTLVKQGPVHEFGFNLHAERGKGHFIGNVDKDGIADRAGLETGQRIVGVNGQLIYPNTPHKEVVALIKRNPFTTELLVASEEIDRWYTETATPFSYDRVAVFEADSRLKAPSSAASCISRHPSEMSGHNNPKSVMKTNGSMGAQSRRETMAPSRGHLQTTYTTTAEYLHPSVSPSNASIVVGGNHTTSIEVHSAQKHGSDGLNQHSNYDHVYCDQKQPCNSPDEKKVFSGFKPPIVHTDIHHHENIENYQNIRLAKQETMKSTEGFLVARNGNQLVEHINKHVIATTSPAPVMTSVCANATKPVPLISSQYSNEKTNEKMPPSTSLADLRDFGSPVSTDSHSITSMSSVVKDENKDIFKLNAKDARQLMKQKKKDPRMQNMSLEEKYNVIANL